MIHELREYTFEPHLWPRYRQLFLTVAGPVRGDDYGRLLGAWQAEPVERIPGEREVVVRFVHLWEYQSLDQRAQLRAELSRLERWTRDFLPHAGPLVRSQHLSVLNPQPGFVDWRSQEESVLYLHHWQCAVGKSAPLLAAMRQHANLCWSTEFPDPNVIACLSLQSQTPAFDLEAGGSIRSRHSLRLTPVA